MHIIVCMSVKYLASNYSVHYNDKVNSETDILVHIGKGIRDRRLQLGYTQAQLSELAHVHRNFISSIERGTRNATILTLFQLLSTLNTNISLFFKEIEKSNNIQI